MFTGLVADLGTVTAVDSTPDGVRLNVKTSLADELKLGDSVAVNGVCLTATAVVDGTFSADVMHESLRRSSLAEIAAGSNVNLELPLRAADRLGGHFVQGHVDGVAVVRSTREDGFARIVTFDAPPELLRYIVEKGSITVDGGLIDRLRDRRRLVLRVAHPRDARAHDAGYGRPWPARQSGGGCARQVRGEAGRPMSRPFATIEEALDEIRAGRMVVVCDDEDRENEGDLTLAAQFATPEAINFMAKEGRGLICLALTPERCDELGLDLMAAKNESPYETAFTVSIEARDGITHRDQRRRPRAHDPGRGRPGVRAARPRPARPHLPAEGQARRRPGAHGADRGRRRPRPAGGPEPRRRDLRGHERRRHDGPRRRPRALLRAPRPEDDHGRRPDRLPAQARPAGRARRRDAAAHRLRRLQRRRLPLAGRRQAPRGAGQGRRLGRRRTCSCACTRSA